MQIEISCQSAMLGYSEKFVVRPEKTCQDRSTNQPTKWATDPGSRMEVTWDVK